MRALATWTPLAVGILASTIGLVTLVRSKAAVVSWTRRAPRWKPYGWGQLCFGAMFLLGSLERPALDVSAALGFAVLIGIGATGAMAVWLLARAQRPLALLKD